MAFSDNLQQLPSVSPLAGLQLIDSTGAVVATIENKPGQAGSLAVYALPVKLRLETVEGRECIIVSAGGGEEETADPEPRHSPNDDDDDAKSSDRAQ